MCVSDVCDACECVMCESGCMSDVSDASECDMCESEYLYGACE